MLCNPPFGEPRTAGRRRNEVFMTKLSTLFLAFARIGALTFGGGYAMLPMLERECVDRYKWATREELLDYFAIGQCTPGVIAVNTATFVGSRVRGFLGAAVATAGVVAPSIVIIVIIAALLSNFAHIEAVQNAFAGIRVAVAALIVNAVIRIARQNIKNWLGILLCVFAFVIVAVLGASPVYVVVGAGVLGLAMGLFSKKNTAEGPKA